ncbi:lysylphosphatidylglycerol synthase domain-containing protein [Phenylobacterium sp.]|uniref:lysylphosphatidylglycerol synthase domain-containing protein n=1 Tax=Phenylobacterium sp. TaxID=1871053 RepID=UPI002E3425E2|nr:lysylphosphatidylglycerol synthase domain-containing protein [Phenylobacterium sp.]HEX4708840.1 lysylphosphatidylglycerol synthase domain-containing protein [Phenylobacterium sp.]
MSKPIRGGLIAALLVGLALLTIVVAAVGYRSVLAAIGAVGLSGFAIFTLCWPWVLLLLGLAWFAVTPGLPLTHMPVLIWGRMVREAASDVLPLAQISGLVAGVRAAQAAGVAEDVVLASTIVDVTTELAAQFLYALLGVTLLATQLGGGPVGRNLLLLIAAALAFLLAGGVAFILLQRRGVGWVGGLAQRWLPGSIARADAVTTALDAVYRQPGRLAAGLGLHILGWLASGVCSWIALRLMGTGTPLSAVLAVESLMHAARSVAFALPGGLGVQEGAYVLLAPLFGLHAADMLALSLLKRARDLVIGVPTLLIWQAREGRALLGRAVKPAASPDA